MVLIDIYIRYYIPMCIDLITAFSGFASIEFLLEFLLRFDPIIRRKFNYFMIIRQDFYLLFNKKHTHRKKNGRTKEFEYRRFFKREIGNTFN